MKPALYAEYYGFIEEPFNITPDPKFLYFDERYREALAHLEYGVQYGKGFVLLTGEVGTGKTTLLNALFDRLPREFTTAFIFSTTMSFVELLKMIHDDFQTGFSADTEAPLLIGLNRFLIRQYEEGKNSVLVLDEAQNLDFALLEKIRLLSNLEARKSKLLQIVLSGQPELMDKLAHPSLRQLNQRIAIRFSLAPLSREETNYYIDHRLKVAESKGLVTFTDEAVDLIYEHSRGIPRLVNIVCGNSLLLGFGAGKRKIDASVVREVIADLTRMPVRLPPTAPVPDLGTDANANSAIAAPVALGAPAPLALPVAPAVAQASVASAPPMPAPVVSPIRIMPAGAQLAASANFSSDAPWTVDEAAAYLRTSPAAVRRLLKSGEIRARRIGRSWRILRLEIDRYVRGGDEPPRIEPDETRA
ncbi:MAG: AAA family ATPase [bacterium]